MTAAMPVVSEIEFMGLGMSFGAPPRWKNWKEERKVEAFKTY
jgi:hypothetical protein